MLKPYSAVLVLLALALAACTDPEGGTPVGAPPASEATAPVVPASAVEPVDWLSQSPAAGGIQVIAGVGDVVEDRIVGTGKSGFLMYGPYVSFQAGTYTVSIVGDVETLPEGTVIQLDVVSGKGKVEHGSVSVTRTGRLPSFDVSVPEAVGDLEVRAHVPEGSKLVIQSYEVSRKS